MRETVLGSASEQPWSQQRSKNKKKNKEEKKNVELKMSSTKMGGTRCKCAMYFITILNYLYYTKQ